jgi:hypothetical protein
MLDSAATPTRKRRKSKTPLKKKNIKRSDSDDENEDENGDGVGSLESEEIDFFEDGPVKKQGQQQQLTRNPQSRLADVDPEALGVVHNDLKPTSSLPEEFLQKMQSVLEPTLPNPFRHMSRVERLQPKGKQSRKGHQQHTTVWETPEAATIRVLKNDRALEYLRMKTATMGRMCDHTKEADVGGAIAKMARQVLEETHRKDQMTFNRDKKLKQWADKLQQGLKQQQPQGNRNSCKNPVPKLLDNNVA